MFGWPFRIEDCNLFLVCFENEILFCPCCYYELKTTQNTKFIMCHVMARVDNEGNYGLILAYGCA